MIKEIKHNEETRISVVSLITKHPFHSRRITIFTFILVMIINVFISACSFPIKERLNIVSDDNSQVLYEQITINGMDQTDNDLSKEDTQEYDEAQVHFINVEQGDCTLIMCDDHYMLIDTGDKTKGTLIQNYLYKLNIKSLDYLILTHPDADHIGGADVIITKFDIQNLFMSSFVKDNDTYNELLDAMTYKGYTWNSPEVGETYSLGSSYFTFIAPNDDYDNPNDSSIGLIYQNGENRFIFTGDSGEKAEEDICNNGIDLHADVYKVGHHGSRTASSDIFLEAVNPQFAVISCKEGNSYGHPHSKTLNSLRDMGIRVFRTDEQGTIVAISDGVHITWNCSPSESWQSGE